jgi:hypothetical protein
MNQHAQSAQDVREVDLSMGRVLIHADADW